MTTLIYLFTVCIYHWRLCIFKSISSVFCFFSFRYLMKKQEVMTLIPCQVVEFQSFILSVVKGVKSKVKYKCVSWDVMSLTASGHLGMYREVVQVYAAQRFYVCCWKKKQLFWMNFLFFPFNATVNKLWIQMITLDIFTHGFAGAAQRTSTRLSKLIVFSAECLMFPPKKET